MTGFWPTVVFWVEFVLLLAAAVLMVWRRLHREFPVLLAYFVSVIAAGVLRGSFLSHGSVLSIQYFYVYWITEAVTVLAAFAALYEVFLIRLFPSFHTTPVYRYLFPAVILLGAVLGVLTFLNAPRHGPNMLSIIVGEVTLALNVLQIALLLFFFLIVLIMGRGWEWHEFGIALGYGVYALSKLITTAVRARAGYTRTSVDQLPLLGYCAALVIWIVYLSRRYKRPDVDIPMEIVDKAQSWDELLRGIMGKRR